MNTTITQVLPLAQAFLNDIRSNMSLDLIRYRARQFRQRVQAFVQATWASTPYLLRVLLVLALIAAGIALLLQPVAWCSLNVLGFEGAGVAGGSIAAGIQSSLYGHATTGLFSVLQSAGATILAPSGVAIVAGASSIFAAIKGWRSL